MNFFTPFKFISAQAKGLFYRAFIVDKKRPQGKKILFVDVTEIRQKNLGTGVQRVTENILKALYQCVNDFEVREVYARPHGEGFFYAKKNGRVQVRKGDVFFGLDLSRFLLVQNVSFLKKISKKGCRIFFFLHDLIPLCHPDFMTKKMVSSYKKWFKTVVRFSGIVCNSKSTMEELKKYLEQKNARFNKNLLVDYSLLGYDFVPKDAAVEENDSAKKTDGRINFLCVSTVEPRKAYDQIILAFENLWKNGNDFTLTIVGKPGWKCEETILKIKTSAQYNKRLFWNEEYVSDQRLSSIYKNCDALIFASRAEGFGLSLVEAASYNKPLILRDIPVFREIAGSGAFYFTGLEPADLEEAVLKWAGLFKEGNHPRPTIKASTWADCARGVCRILGVE